MNMDQLLILLARKLQEISDNTVDMETQIELNELVDEIYETVL